MESNPAIRTCGKVIQFSLLEKNQITVHRAACVRILRNGAEQHDYHHLVEVDGKYWEFPLEEKPWYEA